MEKGKYLYLVEIAGIGFMGLASIKIWGLKGLFLILGLLLYTHATTNKTK